MHGTIIRFFKKSHRKNAGYGFIAGEDGTTYYFSIRDCVDRSAVTVNQNVEFEIGKNLKGKTAKLISIIP